MVIQSRVYNLNLLLSFALSHKNLNDRDSFMSKRERINSHKGLRNKMEGYLS